MMEQNQIGKRIDESIKSMTENFGMEIRRTQSFSFGNREQCKQMFINAFTKTDHTIRKFQMIPEYDQVIDYLTDTGGKGLLLTGDKGRGKSNIMRFVLPTIFHLKNKIIKPIHADYMKNNMDYLLKTKMVGIDEIGTEPAAVDFGERYEPFVKFINAAEDQMKTIFLTTNLTGQELADRYGGRIHNRLERLCKIIKFQGASLRPK